jgi:hypothetical protein
MQEFFRRTTKCLAMADLADIKNLADWHARRPHLRKQLLDMLGLDPLPAKTDLHPVVAGTIDAGEFVVEKLYFQSSPGLYVTANFYRPKTVATPLPTILYLCGHGNVRSPDGKVSYGSKTSYQHHAAWFAREGYCCLILDTLQLGEIEGFHHGTNRFGWWWWVSRGYTPAGVESWNCIRAIDYLETRPEVDMKKIGVTGRSGGGAYTWWTAALDDRPACFVPVAGITDLENHVVDHCVEGHCDCMYMVNTFGWDFATVAALAAPRPLLLSNSDKDTIFLLSGVLRIHDQLKRIYALHGASDKLGLLITEGPHKDTQDLQVPAFRWFNRVLKGTDAPIARVADKPFEPKELTVFQTLPADQKNTTIHETFRPAAASPDAEQANAWLSQRQTLLAALREKCFRNWPKEGAPLDVKVIAEEARRGLTLQVLEFTSEENLRFQVYVIRIEKQAQSKLLVLTPVDTEGWKKWLAEMAPAFGDLLPGGNTVSPDSAAFEKTTAVLAEKPWALAIFPPRGEGPNQWGLEPRKETHMRRRFVLLGRTLEDGQVWDTRRAFQALQTRVDYKSAKPWLQGTKGMAGIALYAGLFEPSVEQFDLHELPASHRTGPTFLNVLRVLDMSQAVALAFPRRVSLHGVDPAAWKWPAEIASRYYAGQKLLEVEQ